MTDKDLSVAAESKKCAHFFHTVMCKGVSLRICNICGDPSWDDLVQDKYERNRLWRCLFAAQSEWIRNNDGQAHQDWMVALEMSGPPS